MIRSLTIILIGLLYFVSSCGTETKKVGSDSLRAGLWRGVLNLQDIELPFSLSITNQNDSLIIELVNAEERIPLEEWSIVGDSIHIPMYIFDAAIHAKILSRERLAGIYVKNYAEDYVVPFEANYGVLDRFQTNEDLPRASFDGKWEVDFFLDGKIDKAIGLFQQKGSMLTGTFITPTGDYRFLEGVVDGDSMKLSCFDGTHAYLFKAAIQENGALDGAFWSGKTWYQKWTAKQNDQFELADPYSLTFMKEGYDRFDIQFKNTSGRVVSLNDERYMDKVVVVQILGSWCPNCMDETRFYTDWYEKNRSRGVEILGLAFERKADFEYATKRVERMKQKLGVKYEILIAGSTSEESRAEALPMLNKILSFPTSIILDKQHRVRKIHTGFSGPGTGVYYENFIEEFNLFMDKLIQE